MAANSKMGALAAYQSVAAHGGVAAADPHRLIVMLLDGAIDRIVAARGALNNRASGEQRRLIHRAIDIVDELRGSLNLAAGGEVAANLSDLYDYACRQLLKASVGSRLEPLDEVAHLLREIRSAWIAMPAPARAAQPG